MKAFRQVLGGIVVIQIFPYSTMVNLVRLPMWSWRMQLKNGTGLVVNNFPARLEEQNYLKDKKKLS